MKKVLPYCAFLHRAGILLPKSGVGGVPVQEMVLDKMRLLWSEIEWPFESSALQRHAMEFHTVISHMFSQGAVVPFRLLSVLETRRSLDDLMAAHQAGFIADLERLHDVVQMECVLFPSPAPMAGNSGRDYLEKKAAALHGVETFIQMMRSALGSLAKEVRVRESKKASRIFVLVDRGKEENFHSIVRQLPVSDGLARRTSGPWPPAEFLTDSVKSPQMNG